MGNWHIGEILIQKKLIDWRQLEDALAEQKRTHEFVGEVLVRKQYIPRFLLFKALAERHALPFVDLSNIYVDPGVVRRLPRSVAQKYGIIPIEIQDSTLVVGIGNPVTVLPAEEIASLAGVRQIRTVLCTPDAVALAIIAHYPKEKIGA